MWLGPITNPINFPHQLIPTARPIASKFPNSFLWNPQAPALVLGGIVLPHSDLLNIRYSHHLAYLEVSWQQKISSVTGILKHYYIYIYVLKASSADLRRCWIDVLSLFSEGSSTWSSGWIAGWKHIVLKEVKLSISP